MAGLHNLGMINALGRSVDEIAHRMLAGDTGGLANFPLKTVGDEAPSGISPGELTPLPEGFAPCDCRNHRLAYAAYLQIRDAVDAAIDRYGAHRVGVVLGSSTAGVDMTEQVYATWKATGILPPGMDFNKQHAMGSVSSVVADIAGCGGPRYTLSTACTSSVKAMISAKGLIDRGFCDAVITGGVDTICHMTINGFESLGTVSRKRANPMSRNREGLNIGEAAALFLMTREPASVSLVGAGESCDAYHMSAPHPEGLGAEAAMRAALQDANITPAQIAYLNMHGTATPQNDAMEAKAIERIFGKLPCSSTKPMVGHTLGAAGAVEAGFCWMALQRLQANHLPLPPHVWDGEADPDIPPLDLARVGGQAPIQGRAYLMSNSFAFGGNNCSIVLAGPEAEA